MSGLRYRLHYLARRTGVLGAAGAMLIAFVPGYYWSVVRPLQLDVAFVTAELAVAKERGIVDGTRTTKMTSREDRIRAFHRFFPMRKEVPGWIAKIYAAADAERLLLPRGEYRWAPIKGDAPPELRITLPLRGNYAQIRRFIARVLSEVPVLSLDAVSFQRQAAGDAQLEAQASFTLFVREIE